MAANEGALGDLHNKVAEVLIDALDGQTIPEITDEEGTVIQPETRMPVSAAHITAAIQFLKNNNITCAPSEDNAMGRLTDKMKERQARREARTKGANVVDFDAARESATFIGGRLTGS
jgi:hypothetical protein